MITTTQLATDWLNQMNYYECYLYRADGSVCGASPFLRAKDVEAIEFAQQIFTERADAKSVELWHDDRQVYAHKERAIAS